MLPGEDERLLRERFPDGDEFAAAMRRLADGEPAQYITGEAYFYGETYIVSPDCLIPRSDTERLVDRVVRLYGGGTANMLDLCTGSGCVAVSSAAHCPGLRVTAVEFSERALALAKINAERNGVAGQIEFLRADILDRNFIAALPDGGYDIITANPPYIATDVIATLDKSVRHEPVSALDGGADGLDFYRVIPRDYRRKLAPGGVLLLEIGYDQADALRALADMHGYKCEIFRDYGGRDRVAELRAL